jgi:hypothetical protein
MTATRDFAAEYLAARIAVQQTRQFSAEERAAIRKADALLRAADRAGFDLYAKAIEIDTAARLAVFGN